MGFPQSRPRRLRQSAAIRRLVAETSLEARQLVLPMFVAAGTSQPRPIASMPGVVRHSRESLRQAAAAAVEGGVGGLLLFGVPETRDAVGCEALDPEGILNAAVADVVAEVGDDAVVMADLCLDEFTDHGHCGVLDDAGLVDNDATLERYARMGVALAEAGVGMVGPSGMMDGQVAAIRAGLDSAGYAGVGILAYSAKYASAFYGPFREAVASTLQGDRRTYQQDPANGREALREAALDLAEGADLLLVKPALGYLDVVRQVSEFSDVPVGAYNVSGEYAMVEAAARAGHLDRQAAILETLTSIRRAGAAFVVTYWAAEAASWLPR
ncbi:MAG: porphobilinogen synthase [Propionibacteriales bacterium]|nr:porphobilinogen synthase [Propionibacteriales bacterium]